MKIAQSLRGIVQHRFKDSAVVLQDSQNCRPLEEPGIVFQLEPHPFGALDDPQLHFKWRSQSEGRHRRYGQLP